MSEQKPKFQIEYRYAPDVWPDVWCATGRAWLYRDAAEETLVYVRRLNPNTEFRLVEKRA